MAQDARQAGRFSGGKGRCGQVRTPCRRSGRHPAALPSPEGTTLKLNLPKRKPSFSIETTGRNAPCPCGSGKKFKQCCGKDG